MFLSYRSQCKVADWFCYDGNIDQKRVENGKNKGFENGKNKGFENGENYFGEALCMKKLVVINGNP